MARLSRAALYAGLPPERWVCAFVKEEPVCNDVFKYHAVNVHLTARPGRSTGYGELDDYTSNIEIVLEHSEDGENWQAVYTHPADLVPGGEVNFSFYHVRRWVRLMLYAGAGNGGRVEIDVLTPEEQVLPFLLHGREAALDCASYCEHSCETGQET